MVLLYSFLIMKSSNYEPTISDLEWVIKEFRKNHEDAELSFLLQELVSKVQKKKIESRIVKPIKLEEAKKTDKGFQKIEENLLDDMKYQFANFLESRSIPKPKLDSLAFLGRIFKNKYVKKGSVFLGVYLLIYLFLNSPIYWEKVKYVFKPTETVKVLQEEIVRTPMANSAALEAGEVIPAGSKLVIPKINVNAPILTSNSIEESVIQSELKNGVVKYANTANPGEVGNTFIVGHSSGYLWDKSQFKYVFVLLDKMEIGDKAKVYNSGKKYVYEVTEKKVVEPKDTTVLAKTDEPYLTLMTCYPPGTTSKRLIVRLKQTAPEYIKPKVVLKEKEVEVPKTLPASDTRGFFESLFYFWQ